MRAQFKFDRVESWPQGEPAAGSFVVSFLSNIDQWLEGRSDDPTVARRGLYLGDGVVLYIEAPMPNIPCT